MSAYFCRHEQTVDILPLTVILKTHASKDSFITWAGEPSYILLNFIDSFDVYVDMIMHLLVFLCCGFESRHLRRYGYSSISCFPLLYFCILQRSLNVFSRS